MEMHSDIQARLRSRPTGYSLEQAFYADPEVYRLDLEAIWYREWLFVGHDCELAVSGSFLTVDIGDYPVLVVRDREGGIRAFHNTCRHRGSRICSAEKGKVNRLVCPYHQWVYELDGRLRNARAMGADFQPDRFGLKPVHCEHVGGYVFVCVANVAPDFVAVRDMMAPYLLPHRLSEAKVAVEMTIVEKGNWKLVWENNRECYHCAANHPELCRTYPEAPTVTGVRGAMNDPDIIAHWEHCRAAGLQSGFDISDDGQFRITRMPLLRDAVSYTMSGKAACQRPLSDSISEPRIGSTLLFHYPSTWNHVLGDHACTFRMLPLSPTETALTTKWLVHKDAIEGVDYDVDELTSVWVATNDQDRRIVEENQRGILSPAYEPGPYAPEHEGGVMQFVEWYCRNLEMRLGGDVTLSRVA